MFNEHLISEDPTITPVATRSIKNDWKKKSLFAVVAIIVMSSIFLHPSAKTNTDKPVIENSEVTSISAPQLSKTQQQLEELKTAINTQKNEIILHNREREEEAEKLQRMRMVAPTTVYSASGTTVTQQSFSQVSSSQGFSGVLGGNGTGDSNTQFMSHVSDSAVPIATATHIAHPGETLAQGTMIWATLETRIVSDLPGMVRAITSEDIYSEDGSSVLLPKGSRLVGQYTNSIAQGQKRVFVVWQRAIRPDHIDIQIASPGTDPLGSAGVGSDSIDHHFFEQFGTAALLSIISAGAANVGVGNDDQFNSAAAYREALANSFAQSAQNSYKSTGTIQPTLYINQGNKVSVFVARDLDFNAELTRRMS